MPTEQLLVRLRMDSTQYNSQARRAATSTGQISQSAKTASRQVSGIGVTAQQALGVAAAGAAVKFGKDTVQAFLGFDDAMNQSLAIMGDVSDTLREDMVDAAREVGKTTRLSAEEAAESYFFLASAGLDAQQAIAAMPQVASFAQAGMFDMATATDLATDAQSALGLTVDDATQNLENLTRVTDVFVRANTLANTSVEQVAAAMTNRAGAAMRALGIEIEEGTAVLAAFADQGVKGEVAGQQLSIVLRDLQTRALENKDAFKEAGVAVFDSQGEFRNMGDIIGQLEDRFAGLSDEQKRAELAALGFSDRSIAALTTLLGTSEAIKEYEEELRNAAGTTEDVADNQLDSFQGQMELLQGRVEDLQLAIGKGLVPALLDLANAAAPVLDVLSLISQGYTDTTGAIADLQGRAAESQDAILGVAGRLSEFARKPAAAVVIGLIKDAMAEVTDEAPQMSAAAQASLEEIERASGSSADEVEVLADGIRDVGAASGSSAGEVEVFTDRVSKHHGAWDDVVTSMENYETMLARLTDPVFRALDDQRNLDEALQDYLDTASDPDASVADLEQSIFDLIEAEIIARGSTAELDEDLQTAGDTMGIVAEQAGVLDEHLGLVDDAIGRLDGRKIDIELAIRRTGAPIDPNTIIGAETGNVSFPQRHAGGPGRAGQPYLIRPGEEIFVPSGNGQFLLNNEVINAIKSLDRGREVNYNIPIQSTGDQQTDAQLVGSITSVLRRMETL